MFIALILAGCGSAGTSTADLEDDVATLKERIAVLEAAGGGVDLASIEAEQAAQAATIAELQANQAAAEQTVGALSRRTAALEVPTRKPNSRASPNSFLMSPLNFVSPRVSLNRESPALFLD